MPDAAGSSKEFKTTLLWMNQSSDDANKGGLPGTVRSQKPINAASGNLKGDLIKRLDGFEVFGESNAL